MIRFANENDLDQIKLLRNISFPQDEAFFKWYFENFYSEEETLVFEKDGIVCSLIGRIPFDIEGIGKVTYIYGVCTHPHYRNQNIMSKLMEFSENIDIKRGIKASILVPQNKSLFEFYKKFGYKPIIKLSKQTYIKKELSDDSYCFRKLKENDMNGISNVYKKCVGDTNYIIRSDKYWNSLFSMFNELSGEVFVLSNNETIKGYAFMWNEDILKAQELLCLDKHSEEILVQNLIKYYNTDKFTAFSPIYEGEKVNYGCIKTYYNHEDKLPISMNMMLD